MNGGIPAPALQRRVTMDSSVSPAASEETLPDGGVQTIWEIPPAREALERLLRDLFTDHYTELSFGPCIQGAVFEIHAERPPKRIGYLDGYLTVDFGNWHLHLCIGEHKGDADNTCPKELAEWRRCARAALVRTHTPRPTAGHPPVSYSIVLWNGKGEQMITFFLPNPWLDEKSRLAPEPDWTRLGLWNHIRTGYLGLPADPGPIEAAGGAG